jgi:hypothetical protein
MGWIAWKQVHPDKAAKKARIKKKISFMAKDANI